ncbi:E3 ubiquitin-protein ligase RNF12-A [Mucuna pruriens]|uniref:E3 ubiquitin-protein ligase RNF12-A n=1 Tax=Mucuna pruriens TaxID=157652 RepID=A0A371GMI1_MUCPR|nr:E3 ubiquitin-protein ligase RNF12-A [Mucuna pruriens]
MGSASSRLGSRPSTPTPRVNRFRLSSLLCGTSTSRSIYQMEEHSSDLQVDSARDFVGEIQKVTEEPSLSCTEARISCSPHAETATSSDMRNEFHGNTSVEGSSRNVAANSQRNCLSEHEELVSPYHVSAGLSGRESYRDSSNTASTSFVEQQSSDPVSVNVSANKDVVNDVNNPVVSGGSQVSHETMHPRSSTPQEHGNFDSGEISVENHTSAFISIQNSSNPVAQVSNLTATSQVPEDEPRRETIPSGLGILVSNRERGLGNDSVLQVDVVTISSNILSGSNADANDQDARRNGRRLFWDAFSRRSSRRLGDSPTIVFSAGGSDDPGSQDRWLVDFGGDLSTDGVGGASGYMGSRIHRLNERRMRHSRSEIWERLRGGFDEIGRWNSCPLGLHADGMCSCESSPMAEESSTRASISRIVMLAEALFEVLDEIHRQPGSLSLSMVSLPAPESIVDSFPLKSHKKVDVADGDNDAEQCYICLAEYEEGDQIRVLPCFHEYHMSCVDKWLKEIHGVCPLCRGNVCGGFTDTESSAHSEVQSH